MWWRRHWRVCGAGSWFFLVRNVRRHAPHSSSYPAKAGYPVIADVSDLTETSRHTGSSAFADDDTVGVGIRFVISRGVLLTPCAWHRRPHPSDHRVRSCLISSI